MRSELRRLPGLEKLLTSPGVQPAFACLSRQAVTEIARQVVDETRLNVSQGTPAPSLEVIAAVVASRSCSVGQSIHPVINATGVLLHTNLGRAPVSEETIKAMGEASRGYINLEMDMDSGVRSSRYVHIESLLCRLTGAEAAIVVNNNASGVLLGLSAMARGKEVIVSRGQAVQIGGGVRIPDIMKQSGAKLVEVGTTNVTEVSDYETAIGLKTAALLKVHSSNFKIVGFTQQVDVRELADLAKRRKVMLLDDLGSGCLLDTRPYGLSYEPMVQESVAAGSDLVFFSGDKLLGGPQAGIIVGKKAAVDKLKKHPLTRAVRIDRTRLSGLVATLMHYMRDETLTHVPIWSMISMEAGEIELRARAWAAGIGCGTVERGNSLVGGGSLPGSTLPTWLLVLREAEDSPRKKVLPSLSKRLRSGRPSVLCRIEKDCLMLDPRSVAHSEEAMLLLALKRELSGLHVS